ncbi:FAD-dependent oxidoreductase [Aliiroseovarius sp.]|uniref:NAD(P)/FAD-dependent oxidoreductase n=1 Tax=Aliiroseovarius sp. TaxID=1872442 RepID=UPI002615B1A5|nr:FAD-dependent oxidoreductase [Aliiroseovarius sp.]
MKPFPISIAQPVEHAAELPDACDVVVIGGGVIGVSTALYLARAGKRVTLLEKGRIAGEQSGRNWGWIRVQGRDPAEIPIMLEARGLWRELSDQVDTDIGLTRAGVAYLADRDSDMERFEAWMPNALAHDLDTRMLTRDELAGLMPGAARDWPGALWTAMDMRAEPFVAVPALARLAAKEGAVIREDCAARGLDVEAGQVVGVISEAGRVRADQVVLAGGAWSALLLRRHGVSIPQLSVRATVAQTAPMAEVFQGGAVDGRLAFRRRASGGYTLAPSGFHELFLGPDAFRAFAGFLPQLLADPLGTKYLPFAPKGFPDAWRTPRHWALDGPSPFEAMRVLNPAPNPRKLRQIARDFSATFPSLGPTELVCTWSGMIDVMPDVVPVVDRVEALPGLIACTGMCGHGFGIGPAFGRITADIARGLDPRHDLSRFRLSRFHDGSKLELGPNL